MVEAFILLFIGLIFLVLSAERLVIGAAVIARSFGLPPIVIGMTILAMGSSAPEMFVSATAALSGHTSIAVGNVLGSNIANIAFIVGLIAIIKPLSISAQVVRREFPLMLGVTLLAGFILWDNYIGFYEGVLLLVCFALFIGMMLYIGLKEEESAYSSVSEHVEEIPQGISNKRATLSIIFGLIVLPLSSHLLVDNSVVIARHFEMNDLVIGLTIIAIGTSLPELAASFIGVLKGEHDMVIGNVIGSNVFNILMVMGVPGLLAPEILNENAMSRDFWVMLGVSVLFFIMALGRSGKITRIEGAILFACFIGYQFYLMSHLSI